MSVDCKSHSAKKQYLDNLGWWAEVPLAVATGLLVQSPDHVSGRLSSLPSDYSTVQTVEEVLP